ncbi:MAG: flagellin [Lachnospiraceae bacterium]|nr:flagellin [Lachnospiraceae bacterium]
MSMNISSVSNQNLYHSYQKLSSGKRINKAADDPAGHAIAEKLKSQINGYDVAKRNAGIFQSMTNVAEGALGSITDSLQRIRELSIQASNGIYTAEDKAYLQDEIEQLKSHISATAGQTQFNTMNLLDGSNSSLHAAVNPNGSGMEVNMPVSTLDVLGISDYDVTGDFDISVIDNALKMVGSSRGGLGATSNRLDYTMAFNSSMSINLTASHSRIEDLDYPKAVTEQKKEQVLMQYRLMMQRKMLDNADGSVRKLFAM